MRNGRYSHKKAAHQKPSSGNHLILLLTLAVITTLVVFGATLAGYITKFESGYHQADAGAFYFSADALSAEGEQYTILCDDLSKATIDFQLFNYVDALHYSGTDIQYIIVYELNGITKTETGNLPGDNMQSNKISYELKNFGLNAFASQAVVNVTAHATSPYDKVLIGTFTLLQSENELDYTVSDSVGSNAGTITAATGGLGGTITITIPSGCLFDPTNLYPANSNINGNTLKFPANPDAEYSIVYLKELPQTDYSGQVTAVLETN